MEDERAKVAFQYMGLYVDRAWQASQTPEAFRFYQGMSAMMNLIPKLPQRLMVEVERARQSEREAAPKRRRVESGLDTVESGLSVFDKKAGN